MWVLSAVIPITTTDIKNLLHTKVRYCSVVSESVVICQLTLKMGEEIDFENEEFLTLKVLWPWPWPWIGSYGIPSCITHLLLLIDLYLHTKFRRNRKNFLRTDGRAGGRTSEPHIEIIRLTLRSWPKNQTDIDLPIHMLFTSKVCNSGLCRSWEIVS